MSSLFIPMRLQKKGGRKMIIVPDGPQEPLCDMALLKALAKAHALQQQLQSGKYANLKDLCQRKKLCPSYARTLLQLNFLSPTLKSHIIHGTQPQTLKLQDIMLLIPLLWQEQHARFLSA